MRRLRLLLTGPLLLLAQGARAAPPTELQQRVAQALKRQEAALSSAECAELVGWKAPVERCELQPAAGGKAALIHLVTECGGDSCGVQVFVYRPGRPVLQLPDSIRDGSLTGGTLVVLPSLEHVITDWVGPGREPGDWRVELYRVGLKTGKASPWVKGCFSPALSPGGRWVLCRNRRGDVLKLPLTGGTPTLVHRSGLSEEDVYWVPYSYVYPEAVTFSSPERMKVTTVVQGGQEARTQEVPWRE